MSLVASNVMSVDTSLSLYDRDPFVENATKDIEGKITLRTPISDDMIVHFSNEGSYTNFKTCLKITYSGSLQHDASLKVDYAGFRHKFHH
jgi:hypothetical protein